MRVTVLIPTYDHGRYIGDAIRSIQAQTFQDFEVVVIDDGSTDETQDVLAAFDDPRLQVVRIPNSGVAVARNTGLQMARGEYIAQLDADDRWRPTMLEKTVAVLDGEPEVCAVFTDFIRFDETREWSHTQFAFIPELATLPTRPSSTGPGRVFLGDAFLTALNLSQYPAYLQATLLRADRVRDIRCPPGVVQSEDLFYMLKVYQRGQAAFIPEPLVEVRRHSSNSYNELRTKGEADLQILLRLAREPMSPEHARALREKTGRAWIGMAYHDFHHRRPVAAARASIRALAYAGSRLAALKRLALLPALPVLANPANADWNQDPVAAQP
jgi:glycosyltransferase involved in cell wall biosynthesis